MDILRLLLFAILILSRTIYCDENDENSESDTSSNSESEEEEEHIIPEYEFLYRTEKYKSGAKKGQTHHRVSLVLPPYVFKKRKEKNGRATFSCNSCQKEGHNTYAHAIQSGEVTESGCKMYTLDRWPNSHECSPESTDHLIKKFLDSLYDVVGKNPTKPIPTIYEECRRKISEGLSDDEKDLLSLFIPKFTNVMSGLYKHRRQFVPQAPSSFVSLFLFIGLNCV